MTDLHELYFIQIESNFVPSKREQWWMMQTLYKMRFVQEVLATRRRHRVSWLLSKVNLPENPRILDIGCGRDGRSLEQHLPAHFQITGIDLNPPDEVTIAHPNFRYIQQDACDLSLFRDKEFDAAFSIGMMEHICDRTTLDRMASEMQRVARQWVVVVPWRYAWVEPHFKLPFFQLLPYRAQCALTVAFDLNYERERVARDPNYLRMNYEWRPTREWQDIFFANRAFVLPTLETIAIVKTNSGE